MVHPIVLSVVINIMEKKIRTISYDIETAYTVSATWGLFEQNVAKVLREPFIISIAWKVLGESQTHCVALPDFPLYKKDKFNDKELVKFIRDNIFEGADILIAHNGNGFDLKWIYGRFAVHGLKPPTPAQNIDTLLIARRKFKFNSNRLNDLAGYFGIGHKVVTGGINLWYRCIELFDLKAWFLMKKYNKWDVILLEKIYLYILPFITNHPNMSLMLGKPLSCKNCGLGNLTKAGFVYTATTKYQGWRCNNCGARPKSAMKEGSQIK